MMTRAKTTAAATRPSRWDRGGAAAGGSAAPGAGPGETHVEADGTRVSAWQPGQMTGLPAWRRRTVSGCRQPRHAKRIDMAATPAESRPGAPTGRPEEYVPPGHPPQPPSREGS